MTPAQRNAMHKYCEMLADALNAAGFAQNDRVVLKLDVPWSKLAVKENIWKPVLEAMEGKTSTEQQSNVDVSQIYEIVNQAVAERTGVHVPWPCEDRE